MSRNGLGIAVGRVFRGTGGFFPAAAMCACVAGAIRGGEGAARTHALDFYTFWRAAETYVDGMSPYPDPAQLTTWSAAVQESFVYPPAVLAALAPLALLPYTAAAVVFVPLLALAVPASLWLLGVRDWRCYGIALLWPATLTGVGVGALSTIVLLCVAAGWRWRDRRLLAGVAIGCAVVVKLFAWPLLVWLWFSGRRTSAVVGAGVAGGSAIVAWSWIGFDGLASYAQVLRNLSETEAGHAYSPIWALGGSVATTVAAAAGCVVVAAIAARASSATGFAVAVTALLLLTPILWLHYLVLLAAVIAVRRPTFHAVWLLPLIAWVTPGQSDGDAWRVVTVSAIVVATLVAALPRTSWRSAPRPTRLGEAYPVASE